MHTVLGKMETTHNRSRDADNARTLTLLAGEEKEFQQLIAEEKNTIKGLDDMVSGGQMCVHGQTTPLRHGPQ